MGKMYRCMRDNRFPISFTSLFSFLVSHYYRNSTPVHHVPLLSASVNFLSFFLPIFLSIYLSLSLSLCCTQLSLSPSLPLSVLLSLSLSLSFSLSTSLFLNLSLSLSLSTIQAPSYSAYQATSTTQLW